MVPSLTPAAQGRGRLKAASVCKTTVMGASGRNQVLGVLSNAAVRD
jgi:hypothetical protein